VELDRPVWEALREASVQPQRVVRAAWLLVLNLQVLWERLARTLLRAPSLEVATDS